MIGDMATPEASIASLWETLTSSPWWKTILITIILIVLLLLFAPYSALVGAGRTEQQGAGPSQVCLPPLPECASTHLLIPPTWTSPHFNTHHALSGYPLAFTHAAPLPGTLSWLPTSPVSSKRSNSNINSSCTRPFPASQAQHISSRELAPYLVNFLPGAFIRLYGNVIHPAGLRVPHG